MIQPNELRLGNRLSLSGKITAVRGVVYDEYTDGFGVYCETGIVAISAFTPIPLTEELLVKCGFVDNDTTQYRKDDLIYDGGYIYLYSYNDGEPDPRLAKCEYLHQLQNLIFALTGEELNVDK